MLLPWFSYKPGSIFNLNIYQMIFLTLNKEQIWKSEPQKLLVSYLFMGRIYMKCYNCYAQFFLGPIFAPKSQSSFLYNIQIKVNKVIFLSAQISMSCTKVRKVANIRNRYNQESHLTQDVSWKSDKNTIKHQKPESRGQPFLAMHQCSL